MDWLLPLGGALYVVIGAGAAVWSHRHGHHRPDTSATARAVSSMVVGLLWPGMALDAWLLDPDDSRRRRRQRDGRETDRRRDGQVT